MQKQTRWKLWLGIGTGILAAVLAVAIIALPRTEAEANRLPSFVQRGLASWYGPGFHGKKTASGDTFDQNDLTAAHRKLPLGTKATVTNLENGKQVDVEINDRGPYVGGRVIDLSKAAAEKIDMKGDGTARVKVEAGSQ
ncbi:MAG: septal ring lytic transglycosylase RlpA family protein [Rhodospirillales bacterium]